MTSSGSWYGQARIDAFRRFEADFAAVRIQLHFNFRSSPDLVRIQQGVARTLDAEAVPILAEAERQVDGDVAQVWNSRNRAEEATHLARWLADDMAVRGRTPRDYALLVRQKADDYQAEFAEAPAAVGLWIRNESYALGRKTLQDVLADESVSNRDRAATLGR